jgi:hypothetical protein
VEVNTEECRLTTLDGGNYIEPGDITECCTQIPATEIKINIFKEQVNYKRSANSNH